MDSGLTTFSDLQLATLSPTGTPPRSRLADVKTATELFDSLRRGDEVNAIMRARVQAVIDGAPPYDDAALRAVGQAYRSNINFGHGEQFLEQSLAAYVDLIESVEHLVSVEATVGEAEQRNEWSGIISEEISRALRQWSDLRPRYLNLARQFVLHGVGVAYFPDETDWRWNSTGLDGIFVPRQATTSEADLEVAAAMKLEPVHTLYTYIEDPEVGKDAGWNVAEVRKAIMKARSYSPSNDLDWARVQAELKNNDLYSVARAAVVETVHLWVREFDGTVSHYITLKDGSNSDFLYKRQNRYQSMTQAFTFFPYGCGTNGTLHSIRGLGYKVFQHLQLSNRLRNQMVDGAMLSSSILLQPESEAALDALAFNYMGPFGVLSPGLKTVERAVPNFSTSAMPVLSDLTETMNQRIGQYQASSLFNSSKERTRFEVAASLEAASRLNVTSLTMFYAPWDRLMREVVRRMVGLLATPNLPGGDVVAEIAARVMARGVPLEAFMSLDVRKTRAVKAVGAGSQAQRTVSLQQLNELAGSFDPLGRRRLMRDQVAAVIGYEQADRYIPADDTPRQPIDYKLAVLENAQLEAGAQVAVLPGEAHLIHLDAHITRMDEITAAVESGELDLAAGTIRLLPIWEHATAHLEAVQTDVIADQLVAAYRARLKTFNEIITNGTRHIEKLQQEQAQQEEQAAMEAQQAPQSDGISPEMREKLVENRLKLKMMEESHQLKLAQQAAEFAQRMRLKDAEKAIELKDFLR